MDSDLLVRKTTHFVLWLPRSTDPVPQLVIGQLEPGNPPAFTGEQRFDLAPSAGRPGLWEVAASACRLADGEVYHYWFEVNDSNPYKSEHPRILCTDPTAWTVDWRLLAPLLPAPFGEKDRDPAGVVKYEQGRLVPCDPGGEEVDWNGDRSLDALPANSRLVIYELPTTWASLVQESEVEVGIGTFRDVSALIDPGSAPSDFSGPSALVPGTAHLVDLGVNALELLPPADSFVGRGWGYATSNYFAADYDLGFPAGNLSPTSSTDFADLIKSCHRHGIRFIADMVMAFSTHAPYQNINYLDFHVQVGAGDPEEHDGERKRDGYGGDLFKYDFALEVYDPLSGDTKKVYPARAFLRTHLIRWMRDFRIDGIRMDSITNIGNWDFVREFKDHARSLWRERWLEQGHALAGADERFLVVGEDLHMPMGLIRQNRLDGLWNESFKRLLRAALLGQNDADEPSFEWTVRKMIDCRLLGFRDGAQAINYVTSHDVEGFRNERLFNFLINNGVMDTEKRIKLAFVCLMTAVGIPMIFAGEEFGDEHDLSTRNPDKEVDPVNYDRLRDPWRTRIFAYVARLVRLRTAYPALAVNDTRFIHVDFGEGKRVLVWERGEAGSGARVVVVANFSDYETPDPFSPGAEYVVPGWPEAPAGKRWREVTQERDVPPEWAGREPIFPWEAKVYALFD